jgi:hypothetical protein
MLTIANAPDKVDFVAALPQGKPNAYYVNQRAPLSPSPFQKLPTGAVKGKGWLKVQLDLQSQGFLGRLAEVSRFLDPKNNAWMGNETNARAGWEELPYWLKGQVSLAYVTGDPKLIKEVGPWVDAIIKSQKADGWFGPEANRTGPLGTPDLWPNMLAESVLQTYYEATGDERVIKLMLRYCDYLLSLPKEQLVDPRHYWHYHRVGDQLSSFVWLYNRTGESKILDIAAKIHAAGANWTGGVANLHGVNFAQAFREPATFSLFSKKKSDWAATEKDLRVYTDEFGQMPGGMYGADENARKGRTDPRQAAESCAIAEMMFSHELLMVYSGDPKWGDHAEDVAFNWMPVTMTADLKALRYLQSANIALSNSSSKNPGLENSGPMLLMDPNDHRCCQHNIGMAWPFFAEHAWFATTDNGLAASILAPSVVKAKVGDGTEVTINEDTDYPFEDTIRFKVESAKDVAFPLALRVPGWCDGASVSVNGKKLNAKASGAGYFRIERVWKSGDVVTLKLPMKVETKTWSQRPGSLSVYRGPLAYSLRIEEEYKKLPRANGWDAYEIWPKSDWNFGLAEKPKFTVKQGKLAPGVQPFELKNVPIRLETTGRQIPEWALDMYGLVAPLQEMPAKTTQPEKRITLIPMGAARLRITVFPTVSDDEGTTWKKPQTAKPSIPATFSFRCPSDTETALSDGLIPTSSNDHEIPRFTWWDRKGTEEWVQYNFEANRTFQACRVYWFDDSAKGGGCKIPDSWKVQVSIGGEWRDVEVMGDYSNKKDGWSEVKFKPVAGTKVRLVAKMQAGASGGILEWQVN